MFSLILLIFFILLFYYIFKNFEKLSNFYKIKKFSDTLPGPSVRELTETTKNGNVLKWLEEMKQKHGKRFCMWFGKDLTVIFTEPDDFKEILSNNQLLYKSNNYLFMRPWLGNGLLTNGGESWHRRRKMLTPAFHFKMLESFKQPMEVSCDILLSRLEEKAKTEEEFDIYPYITLFALDAICETAMGIKKNAQLQSTSEYVTAVETMLRNLHKRSFSFWHRFEFIFERSEAGAARNQALKVLHNETNRLINLRRKLLEEDLEIKDMSDINDTGTKRRLAFLDMLLIAQKEGQPLSDLDIREEVDTFMFEGHDTTSSTLSFAIYLLSQYPDVQQKTYEEALELEGHEKETMKYLEAVIKETLRLYPAVPFFSRIAHEPIKIGDLNIPKGVGIGCLVHLVHRNPIEFPDPEKFVPERHLNSNRDQHPFAFVAFSAGPRNCIGQKFAMLELKSTLAKLLRTYELLPVENFKPILLAEIVMKSANGIKIKLRPRKG